MTRALVVNRIGPSVTVQDMGRPGYLALGLSQGGAADRHALVEGAVLLSQDMQLAVLELPGFGGDFLATADIRIALTGAPMVARIDGRAAQWNASHLLKAGQVLSIGATTKGVYGYLHVGGGFDTAVFLNSRAAHLAGGIGRAVAAGDTLKVGDDGTPGAVGMILAVPDRFSGGTLRLLAGVHTDLFSEEVRNRFAQTTFRKTLRGNRQGAELQMDGPPFVLQGGLSVLSEPMVPGDIQMTGAGQPFVLLAECQTTGGYPRIGVVLPDDLPRVAQATPDVALRFVFITHAEARATHQPLAAYAAALRGQMTPLIRKPSDLPDLLGQQLISGAVTGWDDA